MASSDIWFIDVAGLRHVSRGQGLISGISAQTGVESEGSVLGWTWVLVLGLQPLLV